MRFPLLLAFLLLTAVPAAGQTEADPADVGSIDGIISAVYETLSGPIGEVRDWDRNRSLYHPTARLTHSQWQPGGTQAMVMPMSHEDHIQAVSGYTVERGFYEVEIGRSVIEYGTIAHVWSTYSYTTEDGTMEGRGINSFQLYFDGTRYWIMSVIWSQEAPEHPIPERFIQETK